MAGSGWMDPMEFLRGMKRNPGRYEPVKGGWMNKQSGNVFSPGDFQGPWDGDSRRLLRKAQDSWSRKTGREVPDTNPRMVQDLYGRKGWFGYGSGSRSPRPTLPPGRQTHQTQHYAPPANPAPVPGRPAPDNTPPTGRAMYHGYSGGPEALRRALLQ